MGLPEFVQYFRPRPKVGKRSLYGLTELGKVKAEEFGETGTKWELLNYLDDHGASSLREICEQTHLHEDTAKEVLKRLMDNGYVRRMAQ